MERTEAEKGLERELRGELHEIAGIKIGEGKPPLWFVILIILIILFAFFAAPFSPFWP